MKHTPGYRVTKDGRVFSVDSNWRGYGERELVQVPNTDGYMRVRLTISGKRKSYMVHKLVAEKFLGDKPSKSHEIRHINGVKTDNRIENLVWGTRKENADDRELHGKTSKGELHSIYVKNGIKKSKSKYWRHNR